MDDPTRTGSGTAVLLLGIAWLGVSGCGDGTTGLETGRTSVILSSTGDGGTAALAAATIPSEMGLGSVTLDQVSSIVVTVTRVQAHRAGLEDDEEDENGNGQGQQLGRDDHDFGGPAWVDLAVQAQEIDLISDLAEGQTITLAEGELEAGDYDQIRLFIDEAIITFSEPQPVPGAGDETLTEADVRIPSADQTGIKIPGAEFTVEGEGTTSVEVQFDAGTSVQNVTITGTGEVIMAPVLVGENGDDAGGGGEGGEGT